MKYKYTLFFYGGHIDFWTFNHQTLQSQPIASSAPHWIERPLQWIHQHHGYNVFNHFIKVLFEAVNLQPYCEFYDMKMCLFCF